MITKRGMSKTFLYMMLTIISLMILIPIISHTMESTKKVYNLRACHDSLVIYSKINNKVGTQKLQLKDLPPACGPEGPIIIEDKDPTEAAKQIADLLVRCWWTYGGDSPGSVTGARGGWFPGSNGYNCFSVKLSDKLPEDFIITADSLNKWLKDNNRNGDPEQPTFYDYLNPDPVTTTYATSDRVDEQINICNNLVPGKTYAIRYLDFTPEKGKTYGGQDDKVIMAEWNQAQELRGSMRCQDLERT